MTGATVELAAESEEPEAVKTSGERAENVQTQWEQDAKLSKRHEQDGNLSRSGYGTTKYVAISCKQESGINVASTTVNAAWEYLPT